MGGVDLGVSAATFAALDEAGEQVAWSVSSPQAGLSRIEVLLPGFGFVPQLLGNDTQLGNLLCDPLAFIVEPGDAPARIRILDEALAIPDQLSVIELVVQDARAPPPVAIDC
ncbi:MAG TPA: hypothetical protein PKH39_07820 [Woeseiaceae bacterium]|nr:hypothetical protein [Woeseiaceae bacterium]